jgi:tetratricopeptide (TPR) repeat protein
MTSLHKVSGLPSCYRWLAWGVGALIALGQSSASAKPPVGAAQSLGVNQRIAITPKSNTLLQADSYHESGKRKKAQRDFRGALADYNKAISLNPKLAKSYNNRGNVKSELDDHQGALSDYNKAISIDPQFALAYNNRGLLKHWKLDDRSGAGRDFNKAIAIKPQFAHAYYNRGLLKWDKFDNRAGANKDFQVAAKFFQQQGQVDDLQMVNDAIAKLHKSEENRNERPDDSAIRLLLLKR